MKTFILTLIMLASFVSKSQITMLDSSNVWSEYGECYFSGYSASTSYHSVGGDTLINGKTYKKVYNSNNNTGYISDLLREDSSFVYNSNEEVYYNFNLLTGDTFTFLPTSITPYTEIIVDSVFTKFLFGQMRKVIKFDFLNMEWIEGVGSSTGLLYDQVWYYDCNQNLICFSDSINTYLADGFDSCYISPVGINSISENFDLKIYPNPSRGNQLIISGELRGVKNVSCFDVLGNEFNVPIIFKTENEITLAINNLKKGSYFLKLLFENDAPITKTIIIQ